MNTKKISNIVLIATLSLFGSTLITGCGSSIKKADIAATANPADEIAQLESGIKEGYSEQYDVLAAKDFKKSSDYLESAKESLRKNKSQEKVLEDVAYAKAHLERAKATAQGRQSKAQGVLDSRQAAVAAGARNFPSLKDKLYSLDSTLRGKADDLDNDLSVKEYAQLQTGYQDLELEAIQSTQIGKARSMIIGSRQDGAKENTPATLRTAEIDLENAENSIISNRRSPDLFEPAVAKANLSAKFLVDVFAATKRKGSDLDEASAVKIVKQNYEIRRLKGQAGEDQATLSQMDKSLDEKNKQLRTASTAVAMQAAMESARTQFNDSEAEVYQQGEKLLIRLKSMAFNSGRSDLPSESLSVLAKVKSIAETLKPSEILVEGHTDSTGKAVNNQKLSEQRAAAVAEYLQTSGLNADKFDSIGLGFKRPIASNKSAEGRAQNRRVDIVITPGTASRTPSTVE